MNVKKCSGIFLIVSMCIQLCFPIFASAETKPPEKTTDSELPTLSKPKDNTLDSLEMSPPSEPSNSENVTMGTEESEVEKGSSVQVVTNETTFENNHMLRHDDEKNPQVSYKALNVELDKRKLSVKGDFFAGNEHTKTTLHSLMLYSKKSGEDTWKKEKDFLESKKDIILSEETFTTETAFEVKDAVYDLRYLVEYTVETMNDSDEVVSTEKSQGFFPLDPVDVKKQTAENKEESDKADAIKNGTTGNKKGISPRAMGFVGNPSVVQPIANPRTPVIRVPYSQGDPYDVFYVEVCYSGTTQPVVGKIQATSFGAGYYDVKLPTSIPEGTYDVYSVYFSGTSQTYHYNNNPLKGIRIYSASINVGNPNITLQPTGTHFNTSVSITSLVNCAPDSSSVLTIASNYNDSQAGNGSPVPANFSGNTAFYSNIAGTAGQTYYVRFRINTQFTDIYKWSGISTVQMPSIALSGPTASIESTGITISASVTAAANGFIKQSGVTNYPAKVNAASSLLLLYPSLADATANNSAGRISISLTLNGSKLEATSVSGLTPGKQYWYRYRVMSNFTSIGNWTNAANSYSFIMPKITLGPTTATPIGNGPNISTSSNISLVGTGASYGTEKIAYVYENEADADAKSTTSYKHKESNLTIGSGQMYKGNYSANLVPGKTYWVRLYCNTNYSSVNAWSDKVKLIIPYTVEENYYDKSGTFIKTNTSVITDGSVYQPSGADFNHSSIDYVYIGWLEESKTPGTDTPKNTAIPSFNTDGKISLIYVPMADALYIESVPKFHFGNNNTIFSYDNNYGLDSLQYGGSTNNLAVEFSDKRGASSTGWKLTAKLSKLANIADGSQELTSAELSMGRKLAILDSMNNWSSTVPGSITGNDGTGISLIANGSEVTVFSSATPADSVGSWRNEIDFDSVQLKVLGGMAMPGMKYQGDVTWTINDTP
ncbi:WxL domain-containing protein [Enterococcus gilvus]|uniref:WxL domain-containing protein n=1 Tax=Enterococcus gilvus TaxID=160453 RepID=UPI003D6B0011